MELLNLALPLSLRDRNSTKKEKKELFGGELNPGRPRSVMIGGNTYHYAIS